MKVRERRNIEATVTEILTRNELLRAPIRLEPILRREGIHFERTALPKDVSGYLFRRDDYALIGVNSRHPTVRQRFTIAHELGHYFLGHRYDEVHVDKNFVVKYRDVISGKGENPEEVRANAFAAALLMPRALVISDIARLEYDYLDDAALRSLARKYAVSVQSLSIRLMGLRLSR